MSTDSLWCHYANGNHLVLWICHGIDGCLCFIAFTMLSRVQSTPCILTSQMLACDYFITYCVSSIAALDSPPLAILGILKAWCMLVSFSCTVPPCLALVADMLKTYKKIVAASNNEILI
jgi:hypothetical protein